ncbi:UrcA family protein [Amphiplicatus metriothermophilus]|uniref:UrcA family protein n=1 Tax=Amphiplicatus metriothermophilus TaxID=1519374 RepID=A0A239PKL2_9PROT|nr:UrcA family protein [Amphiplicatus metriothermophilus]MBB5517803.1 UrcA family protein [Amphiplicatus metriothermophilus]SNT67863.1 UrcA family protein [Amphiplicatus metriothermophilus]
MIRTSFFAIAAITALSSSALADVRVRFDRDALDDPAEVAALYERIEEAARKVCREARRDGVLGHYTLRGCVKDKIAEGVAAVDSPALTAYAEGSDAERRRLAAAN